MFGLRSVVLPTRRDVHGRDQRLRAVGGGRRELVAVKALLAALAAVAHLGVDRRDDPVAAGSTMQARHAVLVDVEVLADQFAQQLVCRLHHIIIEQPRRPLDRGQRPLSVLGHPGEHPFPLGLLPPATIRLLARPRVVELKPPSELLAGIRVGRFDRADQLLDSVADQPDGVLGSGRPQHRRGIDDLLGGPIEHPQLPGQPQRVLERQPLLLVQQQPRPVLGQRRRMPALMIDRQTQRHLPAQIPRHRLHRLLIRGARAVLQQHHLRQQRRRDGRTAQPRRIALREVLITHNPITVLCQQREKRPLRQWPRQHRRIEHPNLRRLSSKHARMVLNPPDSTTTISGVF